MIEKGYLKLTGNNFINGLLVAVFTAIVTWLAQLVNLPGFNFAAIDWGQIVSIASVAAVGYLSKKLVSDENGKVLGQI